MSGNKLQIAVIAGTIATAGIALQAGIPRLANDAGLLYLRAQYKLATGDPDSALRLMQQAAAPSPSQPQAKAANPAPQDSECPYAHTKPIASATTPGVVTPHVVPVRQTARGTANVRRVALLIPGYWSTQQMRIMAQVQARQAEQQAHLRETLAQVQAQLRSLPVAVPVSMPTLIVPGARAALP